MTWTSWIGGRTLTPRDDITVASKWRARLFGGLCTLGLLTVSAGCSGDRSREGVSEGAAVREAEQNECSHLRGGGRGVHTVASDLGRAHALVRYFSTEATPRVSDGHLADALDGVDPSEPDVARAYATRIPDACATDAEDATLGPATVTMVGDTAVVTPGVGRVIVPEGSRALALDLRALPESEAARAAVVRTLGDLLASPAAFLSFEERRCDGHPDEVWSLQGESTYSCASRVRLAERIDGAAPKARPLAVLTASKLTPLAAFAALSLRETAGAFLVGDAVHASVAESQWIGIGGAGIAIRTRRLFLTDGRVVPDRVDADVPATDPFAALTTLQWSAPLSRLEGPSLRRALPVLNRPTDYPPMSSRTGDGRAALMVAYAATRTFFPYLGTETVQDALDERLDEVLGALRAGGVSRVAVARGLHRYFEALHDGHVVVRDRGTPEACCSPVSLTPIGEKLVVAVSASPEARPGDEVLTVDGSSAFALWVDEQRYVSGSPHVVRARAAEQIIPARETQVVLRSPNGTTRTVTLRPIARPLNARWQFERARGPLADLGAADVYYVSMDGTGPFALPAADAASEIIEEMRGMRAVILDMRGYPIPTSWLVLRGIVAPDAFGPDLTMLDVGPTDRSVMRTSHQLMSEYLGKAIGISYEGPVVVLTGHDTQSQAEHWTSFFRSKNRGLVVGERTSGANGNITGVGLPGGYAALFTGMRVEHPGGGVFHARGHIPDIEVTRTVEEVRDGTDVVLLRAIEALH